MEHEFQEYVTFHVTAKDGTEVEMAVVDEFDFEGKHYVAASVVREDIIDEEGTYLYEAVIRGTDFEAKKIDRVFDYNRIAKAYMNLLEHEE